MLIEVHFVAQIDVDDIAFSCEVRWEVTRTGWEVPVGGGRWEVEVGREHERTHM